MRFLQTERDLRLDILTSHGEVRACASAVMASKKSLKEITEAARASASAEDFAKVTELDTPALPAGRRREVFAGFPVRPEAVVPLALLRVGQHFVCLVHFFEFLLCRFVSRVDVRVVLARQLSVRFLDL